MKNKFFRNTAAIAVSVLAAAALTATAFADELLYSEITAEEIFVLENPDEYGTNDELLEGYFIKNFYGGGFSTFADIKDSDYLSDKDRELYNSLLTKATAVASGSDASSVEVITMSGLTWSYEELGLAEDADAAAIQTALGTKLSEIYNFNAVYKALLADNPYELYWNDKTKGFGISYSMSYNGVNASITKLTTKLYVANGYQGADDTTVDTTATTAASVAATNARTLVEENSFASDYEKLLVYKDYICDAVEYNYDAVKNDEAYGNPWQMIYVFDGNPDTNVVCEGYAKAFMFLCEESGIECYTTTGDAGGAHMWNTVVLDGTSYLVDITNCDGSGIGSPDNLFLKGMTKVSDTTYKKEIDSLNTITYVYDSDTIAKYPASVLAISETDYAAPAPTGIELNSANFIDPIFRNYLGDNYDIDDDGYIDPEAVTRIDITDIEISDLGGIEHFTELRVLICSNCTIRKLDVSNNKKLERIDCDGTQLSKLDVASLEALNMLNASDTPITSINLRGCAELDDLNIENCTSLGTIDLSYCPDMMSLNCNNCGLTQLDVSALEKLSELYCADNNLTELDLSSNTLLTVVDASRNSLVCLSTSENLTTNCNVNAAENVRTISEKIDGTYDLSDFTGFDVSRAASWDGATVEGNILTVTSDDGIVTYMYTINDTSSEAFVLEFTDIEVPSEPAIISGYSISLNGNIGVNFYMTLSDEVAADTDAYMQFTIPGRDVKKVYISESTASGGYRVFSCAVAAKEMTADIKAEFILGDGTVAAEGTYTVKGYADYLLDNQESYAQYIDLVKSMLNYGAYSQIYFGYNTDNLANADLDEADKVIGTSIPESCNILSSSGTAPDGITCVGATLVFESDTIIRYYFNVEDGTDISAYNFTSVTGVTGANYYYETAGIPAHKLADANTLTVGGYSVTYSPLTYAYRTAVSTDKSDDIKNVCYAMYEYYLAAAELK